MNPPLPTAATMGVRTMIDVIAGTELLAAAPGQLSTLADEEEAILITVISKCIWNLGTHEFRYYFTIFFIYMNSYMNS